MKKRKKKKSNRGRKLFDGKNEKSVLQKLEAVWVIGGTDKEACLYADISVSALMQYQNKRQKYLQRKDLLKQTSILRARQTVVSELDKNAEFALKYLERKLSKEFALSSTMKHTGDVKQQITYRILNARKKR